MRETAIIEGKLYGIFHFFSYPSFFFSSLVGWKKGKMANGVFEAKKVDLWVDDTLPLSATIFENEIDKGVVVRSWRVLGRAGKEEKRSGNN